ncbi:unnamed protein product [Polarella glacialis]|uniref:Uncharacterized protein n=1 Tax=Polarella glacialis TaxID=89957 RepID=A0A813G0W6_POLGL|nr:unnamed protein product [Polarella glacialis]CAE8645796.1 unnamed protein product [Polarella glacialis]
MPAFQLAMGQGSSSRFLGGEERAGAARTLAGGPPNDATTVKTGGSTVKGAAAAVRTAAAATAMLGAATVLALLGSSAAGAGALGASGLTGLGATMLSVASTTPTAAAAALLGLSTAVALGAVTLLSARFPDAPVKFGWVQPGPWSGKLSSTEDLGIATAAAEPLSKRPRSLDASEEAGFSAEEAPAERDEEPHRKLPRRRVFAGRELGLMRKTRRLVASWTAALIHTGVKLEVDGKRTCLKLVPDTYSLAVGEEVLQLIDLAFELQGQVLRLVTTNSGGGGPEPGVGSRSYALALPDADHALELALTLKVLRAEADSGAGVGAFTERPPDQLGRPPPAE